MTAPDLEGARGASRKGRAFLNPDGSVAGQSFRALWRLMREARAPRPARPSRRRSRRRPAMRR
ncbi:hypothetical protein D9598_02060 [Roseomonas sp. KE0001]|nr:hypothetical protein [Roseomonas sp. KE0001]